MCAVLFVTASMLGQGTTAGASPVTWPVSTGADGSVSLAPGTYVFNTDTGAIVENGVTTLLPAYAPSDAHAWNFASLTIASGASVTFQGNLLPDILVSGDASISGTVNLHGSPGTSPGAGSSGSGGGSSGFSGATGQGTPPTAGGAYGQGGTGGAAGHGCAAGGGGGGNGGAGGGGAGAAPPATCAGGMGGGVTGGPGGLPGPNGGHGTDSGVYAGQAGQNSSSAGGGGGGSIGTGQSDLALTSNTLEPGSGGGGGGSTGLAAAGGGGGGGGALQIVAGGTLSVAGTITANGGAGGNGFAGGGGGSGGVVELAAPSIAILSGAAITTQGAQGGTGSVQGGTGGVGGLGRIRIAADQLTVGSANLNPAIGPANGPGLAYVSRWSSAVVFTTTPPSVEAGVKTGAMSVALEGNDGNPVVAPAGGMQLSLGSTSSTGVFYDATGTTPITSVTVPAGSSTATFQYSDTSAGTPTVTVTPPGGSGLVAATQQVTETAPPLSVETTSVKDATVGVAYRVKLGAEGGVPPYTWTLSSGALPSGVKLSKAGVVSGTPTASGQFTFGVTVQDADATVASGSLTLTVIPLAADGAGTLTAAPRTAVVGSVGNTLTFTYHVPTTGALAGGSVQIVVPSGWSAPSVLATDPGDVTAGKGVVSVVGMTITVTGLDLAPGTALKIVYGAKGGGGPGAMAPSTAGKSHFLAAEQSTGSGVMTSLAASPSVKVS